MTYKKTKFYYFIFSGCLAGYLWLYWETSHAFQSHEATSLCLLKHTTGIPCPSCGSTRAVISILHGDFFQALSWNPLGYLLLLLLIILPVLIFFDSIFKKDSLLRFYGKVEMLLLTKKIAIPALVLILLNWYWNIQKGL